MTCYRSNLLYFTFLFFLYGSVACPCTKEQTIDITVGKLRDDGSIIYEDILYKREDYFIYNNRTFGCICNVKTCIPKCCPEGYMFVNRSCEFREDLQLNISDIFVGDGDVRLLGNKTCQGSKAHILVEDIIGIYKNSHVQLTFLNITDVDTYCIEANEDPRSLVLLWCFEGMEDDDKLQSYKFIGMIISMPFLLVTFIVYALLPDRNLPAKALMCYVLSLLFAYILLVTIQLDSGHESTTCITLAFFCYFFFMASFFWMNASCLDIFFTFSGIRGLLGEKKKENKRFLYYSGYAWGVPILMVGFASIFTFGEIDETSRFYTGLGNGQCWFKGAWATGIYFYFPIAILLIVNIVLFGITTYKIKSVQRDTKMLKNVDSRKHKKYDSNDQQRFNLYVKLLFAMGINWAMEVISWAIMCKWSNVPDYVWVLTDFCNAVYGVFIFFIFVFKRNIWMLLKKRYLQLTGRPQQAHTLTSTHRTTVTASIQSLSKSLERKITPTCLRYDESEKNLESKI